MHAKDTPQPPKLRFLEICKQHKFDSLMLHTIADLAQVSHSIVDTMFEGQPVARTDAEKVLTIRSQHVGRTLNLETVDVPVLASDPHPHQRSEVARLKAQIQEEYEAARRAMSGFASGTAQHRCINARMEN